MVFTLRVKQALLRSVGESIWGKTKPQRTAYAGRCSAKCFLAQGCWCPPRTPLPVMLCEPIRFHACTETCRVLILFASLWLEKQKKRTPGRKLLIIILLHFIRLKEGISHQGEGESTPEHQR